MRRLDAIYDVTAADQKKMYCVERKMQKKREEKAEKAERFSNKDLPRPRLFPPFSPFARRRGTQ